MKERPILFSAPMVRAILGGMKTQTRRIVKPQPVGKIDPVFSWADGIQQCAFGPQDRRKDGSIYWRNVPWQEFDRLWVRETWGKLFNNSSDEPIFYKADYSAYELETQVLPKWKPSIHMPRQAARIDLEVIVVRVERLQDISAAAAIAEGVEDRCSYESLWESINGAGSWQGNPLVWVIEFEQLRSDNKVAEQTTKQIEVIND